MLDFLFHPARTKYVSSQPPGRQSEDAHSKQSAAACSPKASPAPARENRYVPVYGPQLSTERAHAMMDAWGNRSWCDDVLREPIAPSQDKKHAGAIGFLKLKNHMGASRAARHALGDDWTKEEHQRLSDAFAGVPACRRFAVAQALRKLHDTRFVVRVNDEVFMSAFHALARHPQATLERAVMAVCKLAYASASFKATPMILTWLQSLPEASYAAAVAQAAKFLPAPARMWELNLFCKSAIAIGNAHFDQVLAEVNRLAGPAERLVYNAHTTGITLLAFAARVPQAQRRAWFGQVDRASLLQPIARRLEIAGLLFDAPMREREALADALQAFFYGMQVNTKPACVDLFQRVEKLPASRRALYLQSLSGCLEAARNPLHQPNGVALAVLVLYNGYIDSRLGVDEDLAQHVGQTLQHCMRLEAPEKEAGMAVVHAKALAGAFGEVTPTLLTDLLDIVLNVAPAQQARFVALGPKMFEGFSAREDCLNITRLLAMHAADDWSTLQAMCRPLREAGLSSSLVADGVQALLSAADTTEAFAKRQAFFSGGLASAAMAAAH